MVPTNFLSHCQEAAELFLLSVFVGCTIYFRVALANSVVKRYSKQFLSRIKVDENK